MSRANPETRALSTAYAAGGQADAGRAPFRAKNHVSARTVGALTPKVTKAAFQKYGFATAQLVGEWRAVVGDRLAATTAPEKLRWPRRTGEVGDFGGEGGARSGAALTIRVEPAVALDVQYKTALILDRINAWFGYRAVTELRIVQGRVQQSAAALPSVSGQTSSVRRASTRAYATTPIQGIADDGLKAALERMQAGLANRRG